MVQGSARCPVCGSVAARAARYCGACGSPLDAPAPALTVEVLGSGADHEREVSLGGPEGRGRGRAGLVVGTLAVALVAAGLAVGSGGGDDEAATPEPSAAEPDAAAATTAAATTTTTTADRPTRTTRPTSAPTTAAPPAYAFAAPPDLGGTGLYATTGTGDLIAVDPAGEVRLLSTDTFGSALLARQGGVVDTDWNRNVYRPDDGGPPVQLRNGSIFPAADPALAWIRLYDESEAVLQRVTDGGVLVSVRLPVDVWPSGVDGNDLLVTVPGSGTYRIDPLGTASLVMRALVVDASATTLVFYDCDEAMRCASKALERSTGGISALPLDAGSIGSVDLDPTGTRLALVDADVTQLSVIDIATGSRTELGEVQTSNWSGSTWSADGSHLFWIDDGDLQVWRVGADAPTTVYLKDGARDRHLRAIGVMA